MSELEENPSVNSSNDTTSDDATESMTDVGSTMHANSDSESDSDSDSSTSSMVVLDRDSGARDSLDLRFAANRDSMELSSPVNSLNPRDSMEINVHSSASDKKLEGKFKKDTSKLRIDEPEYLSSPDDELSSLSDNSRDSSNLASPSPSSFLPSSDTFSFFPSPSTQGKTVRFDTPSPRGYGGEKSPLPDPFSPIETLSSTQFPSYEERLPPEYDWCKFPNNHIEIERAKVSEKSVEEILKRETERVKSQEKSKSDLTAEDAPLFVKALCEQFRKENVCIKNMYNKFSKVKTNDEIFKNHHFQKDSDDCKAETDVKFNTKYLESTFETATTYISRNATTKMMKIYDMVTDSKESTWGGSVEKNVCNRDRQTQQNLERSGPILFEFLKFETQFDVLNIENDEKQIEPLFLSMFLVDTQKRRRISEVFHVDLNEKQTMSSLVQAVISDSANDIKNAIFHINDRSVNVYLIILVSKVLEGDEEGVALRYMKPKPKSVQAKKLKSKINTLCSRFGNFRQNLAWSYLPLFEGSKSSNLAITGDFSVKQFYRCRGSMTLESLISTIENTNTLRKLKFIPALLDLRVTELEPFDKNTVIDNLTYTTKVVVGGEDSDSDSDSDDSDDSDDKSDSSTSKVVIARNIFEFRTVPNYEFNTEYMHNMYVRPLSVNLTSKELKRKQSQNVAVQIDIQAGDERIDGPGLIAIYGRSSEPLLLPSGYATVTYHERSPEFSDEFKVRLPSVLTAKHNFVFTFYHVSLRGGLSKKQNTVIGRAFVPVLEACGTLISGKKSLPIAIDAPKDMKDYLSRTDLKYLSNGKLLFNVEFEDASTIHTHDQTLNNFYQILPLLHCDDSTIVNVDEEGDKIVKNALDSLLITSKNALHKIVQVLPTIFDHLLRVICYNQIYPKSSIRAFHVLVQLCSEISIKMREKNRNTLLTQYIQHYFKNFDNVPGQKKVYESILSIWTQIQMSTKRDHPKFKEKKLFITKSFEFSWVLFDLTVKSLTLHLDSLKLLNNPSEPRWKCPKFSSEMMSLISSLTMQLSNLYEKHLDCKNLNNSFALFMRDMLDIVDRDMTLSWIDTYLRKLCSSPENHTNSYHSSEMRVQFIEILADYEQFVPMSLPKQYSIEATTDLDSLFSEHFLGGLILRHISRDLVLPHRNGRQIATTLLRNILTKHEYDSRYQDSEARSRIISMYFPLVLVFLDRFNRFITLNESKENGLKNTIDVYQSQLDNIEAQLTEYRQKLEMGDRNNKRLLEQDIQILEEKSKKNAYSLKEVQQQYEEERLRCKDEKQSVFVCILYILVNMDRSLLKQWISVCSKARMEAFFKFLKLSLEIFEYRGKQIIATSDFNHDSLKNVSETKSFFEQRYNNINNSSSSLSIRSQFSTFRARTQISTARNRPAVTSMQVLGLSKWEGCLSSEVTLSIMSIMAEFVHEFEISIKQGLERKDDMEKLYKKNIFPQLFNIIISPLSKHESQSRVALRSLSYMLKIFIDTFQPFLFEPETPYTEELCITILKTCCSIHKTIRSHATAILYTLFKNNYIEVGRFTKTKMNTTVALSNLVESLNESSVSLLQKCFETITLYAQKDPNPPPESLKKNSVVKSIHEEQIRENSQRVLLIGMAKFVEDTDFPSQVIELIKRLNATLLFTVQVNKERENDTISSESVAENMLRIAHNYRHAPELSMSWFNNLYKFHDKCQRDAEAAMVAILMAATSFQYLKLKKVKSIANLRYAYLEETSPTLKKNEFTELRHLFDDPIEPEFSHTFFTESGFIQLIYRAIASLKKGKHYEFAINLFKLLVQYYESQRAYKELHSVYLQMAEYYDLIEKCREQNRLFGTYYKIGLFGKRALEKNGCEYIYKFPKITRLGEVSDYINKYFSPIYGADIIKIKSESFKIDDSVRNDEDFVYIQVACVNPNFDSDDVRLDYFENNSSVRAFIYEAPYTLSGKAHGSVTDQCIRKTIVTSKHAFPGLLTQTDVSKKEIIELSPIEYAIQTVERTVQKIEKESMKDPPDINSLHLVLSGSLIPTVNEGIPAIVKAFLGDEAQKGTIPENLLNELRENLRAFMSFNGKAVIVSSHYKTKKQAPLHSQFLSGYNDLYTLITTYIGTEGIISPEDLKKQAP